jgi:hypothetical protein
MDNNLLLFMFIAIVFVGILMLVIIGTSKKAPKSIDKEYYDRKLKQIEGLLESGGDSDAHMAILNADKLLDNALKARGFRGETMGERLKSTRKKGVFKNENAIWAAHKLRNRIAHEDDISVNADQAQKVINTFRSGLKDLGAL